MFIIVKDARGNPIPECAVRLVTVGLTNPDGSNQSEYRHTDEGGNCAWTWYPHDVAGGYDLEVNNGVQNNKPQFTKATKHVTQAQLEGEQQVFTLADAGSAPGPSPITGNGTCDEWRRAVLAIFAKHGYATVGPDNEGQGSNQAPFLRATIAEIKMLHPSPFVQWQYESVGNPPELRPRLFLPHNGGDPFERYADLGNWNGPLKWEHCQ